MDFSQDNEESIDNHDGNSFSPTLGLYSLATTSFQIYDYCIYVIAAFCATKMDQFVGIHVIDIGHIFCYVIL